MKWFGKSWGAPVCEPEDHVDVPEGESCCGCGRPVDSEAQGVVIPFVGETQVTTAAYHLDCFLHVLGLDSEPPEGFFDDLDDLEQALEETEASNPEVGKAAAALETAQRELQEARDNLVNIALRRKMN